jgi:CRP/FNR family cyclic AMP-dependent transcriptional regulator
MKQEDQLFWKFGRNLSRGTVIFREGDPGHEMFIIQKGKVQVKKKVGNGEKVLAELSEGEFFGEMALLLGMDRSATVEVIEDSKVLVINPETFESLLKNRPEIALKMLKKMALRLRALDEKLEATLT